MGLIIAGTGHRPNKLGGYSQEAFERLYKVAKNYLESNKNEISQVISGMALGWDQALCKAAIDVGIPVLAAIPCKDHASKWPTSSQKLYFSLLENPLVTIHYVSDKLYTNFCMQKRNEFMVDNCDKVLALWDKTPGGTKNCVEYADSKGKEITNLYKEYLNNIPE